MKYYLINNLQNTFLNDVEAEAAYFSRFRFHQNMTPSASTSLVSITGKEMGTWTVKVERLQSEAQQWPGRKLICTGEVLF